MRYLWLIRHAKSADNSPDGSDHQRPLNDRGEKDCGNVKAWLSTHDHRAEWLWSSTATRALSTANHVAEGFDCPVVEAPSLYLADPDALMDVLRATPPDVEAVAVVAHNPGLTQLSNLLSSDRVTDNLVTLGCALFATDAQWSQLTYTHNYFISVNSPKGIKQKVS